MAKNKGSNTRNVNRFRGYFLEDIDCKMCLQYRKNGRPRKRGNCCGRDICLYTEEKRDAWDNHRIKRKRGAMKWDD